MKPLLFMIILILFLPWTLRAGDATVVSGTVKSITGHPFPKADVHICDSEDGRPDVSAQVDGKGNFTISTTFRGKAYIVITAPHHRPVGHAIFLYGQPTLAVDAVLETYLSGTHVDSIQIIGDFNRFEFDNGILMTPDQNGLYSARIPSPKKRTRYQIVIYESKGAGPRSDEVRSINGVQYDELEYDSAGDYRSVINTTAPSTTVSFDISKLPIAQGTGYLKLMDARERDLVATMMSIERTIYNFQNAFIAAGTGYEEHVKLHDSLNTMLGADVEAYAKQTDDFQRELMTLRMLSYVELSGSLDQQQVGKAIGFATSIPPSSIAWSAYPTALGTLLKASGGNADTRAYLERVATQNMAVDVRPAALYFLVGHAADHHDTLRQVTFFRQLVENHPYNHFTTSARLSYVPRTEIVVGKSLPAFTFPDFEQPKQSITGSSLKGKFVLIDLWATWCGPCVEERDSLLKLYRQFEGPQFQIVSISLDSDPQAVRNFRKNGPEMPWQHVHLPGVWKSPPAELFEVATLPKIIVVNPEGKIIGVTNGLKGAGVDRIVARAMGQ